MNNAKKSLVPHRRFKEFQNAGAWEQRKLGDIATFSKGSGYSKADLKNSGTPVILYGRLYTNYELVINSVNTFTSAKNNSVYSKGGEVIVPASGETAKDISIASVVNKPNFLLGGDLNIIHPSKNIKSVFLAVSISNGETKKDMARRAQGKSIVHLHNTDLSQIKLAYPSETEQKKIDSYFLKFDSLIALHQRKLNKLKKLKSAYLTEMFPDEGEHKPKRRFAGFTDDWEQRKLTDLSEAFTDGDWIETKDQSKSGIRLIQTGNIGINQFLEKINNAKWISIDTFSKLSCTEVIPGDILISRLPDPAGRACLVPKSHHRMIAAVDCTIFRVNNKNQAGFIVQVLETDQYFSKIKSYLAGGTRQRISRTNLGNIDVMVPSRNEQLKISTLFKQLDNLITLHQRKIDKLQKLKNAYLNEMFV